MENVYLLSNKKRSAKSAFYCLSKGVLDSEKNSEIQVLNLAVDKKTAIIDSLWNNPLKILLIQYRLEDVLKVL
jgi:hypothetical protein